MRELNEDITLAFRSNLVTVAQSLERHGIIPQAVLEQMSEVIGIQSRNKAAELQTHVSDKVMQNAKRFDDFVLALEEIEMKDLAKDLKEHREKLKAQ